jgi:hypothetical protein
MKKARLQVQERLSTGLAELIRMKPSDFIHDDFPRDLSFRAGLQYFDRTLELFHRISRSNLGRASLADLATLADDAERTLDQFNRAISFTVEDVENAREARDLLIEEVRDSFARISIDFERAITRPLESEPDPSTIVALTVGLCTLAIALATIAYYSTHERTVANSILNAVHGVRLL